MEILLYENSRTKELRLFRAPISTLGPDWVLIGKAVLFQTEQRGG